MLDHGLECLRRVKGDQTWEDWMGIGAALMVITEEAMEATGAQVWNANDRQLVREFNMRWDEYEASAVAEGSNVKPVSKQERWALREVMTNPQIGTWRNSLDGVNRRKLNHPNKVIERWKRATQTKDTEPKKPSPSLSQALKDRDKVIEQQNERLKELGEELESASAHSLTLDQLIDALVEHFKDMSPDAIQAALRDLNARILTVKGVPAKRRKRKKAKAGD